MAGFKKTRIDLVEGETPRPLTKRDSFVFPVEEHEIIEAVRLRATRHLGITPNKNEVLRAALKALSRMENGPFIEVFGLIGKVPKGRPRKRLR